MTTLETAFGLLAGTLAGAAGGAAAATWWWARRGRLAAEQEQAARAAREGALARREQAQAEGEARLAERETAALRREAGLDERAAGLLRREQALEAAEQARGAREAQAERRAEAAEQLERQARSHAESILAEARGRLAEVAGLPQAEARQRLLDELDAELSAEKARRVLRAHEEATAEAERRARDVVLTAVQRLATTHAGEASVTAVPLPNEEMKGRIIGREGRNVKAFETATGCDVIVDETPGQVTVSCFDPVRREVARQALSILVSDGRIHPARIEEVVAEAQARLSERVQEEGRRALAEADVHGVDPLLVELLGRLAFRSSYGQNVLRHSVEAALLAGALAAELGLDAPLARRAALLHDVGKALDATVGGAHAEAAGALVRRLGEPPEVVAAVEEHHDDLRLGSPYAVLAQVADAVSASRPGARLEPAERYARRLGELEALAAAFPGVEKAYALGAGREVRVIVDAARVSDALAPLLAHEIARAVEAEITFPGEVKVTVVREVRAVDVAR